MDVKKCFILIHLYLNTFNIKTTLLYLLNLTFENVFQTYA